MKRLIRLLKSEKETRKFGAAVGARVVAGTVIAIRGELGAGKTCFVKGLAAGLGIDPAQVTSPSYTIVHEHQGRLPLYHIDLYRLDREGEALTLGLEEYFEAGGVCAVEWAERAPELIPEEALQLDIQVTGPEDRRATLEIPQVSEPRFSALLADC